MQNGKYNLKNIFHIRVICVFYNCEMADKDLKDTILKASLELFLKHGIRNMTIQKLVGEMDLSTKTVYKFFSDKEDLLHQCLQLHYRTLAGKLSTLEWDVADPVTGIFSLWRMAFELDFGVNHLFYHDLNYYYPQLQDSIIKKTFHQSPAILINFIHKGIEEGYFHKDIHPPTVLVVMETLYTTITRTDRLIHSDLLPEAMLRNTLEPYIIGLCTTKGIKAFNSSKK